MLDSIFELEKEESMNVIVGNLFNCVKGVGERGLGAGT